MNQPTPIIAPFVDHFTLVFFLLGAFVILAWVRLSDVTYFKSIFISTSNHISEDISFSIKIPSILLAALYLAMLSLFVTLLFIDHNFLNYDSFNYHNFLTIAIVVFIFYTIKIMLMIIAGSFFGLFAETKKHLFLLNKYTKLLGIALIPIIVPYLLISGDPPKIIEFAGLSIISIFFIIRIIKTFQISSSKKIPIFYNFLYLCTLEILPLIVLIKVIKVNTVGFAF